MLRSLQMVALPFGTSVSSEIFQKKLLEVFDGLAGVVCVADDVIIHGKTLEDHDEHLPSQHIILGKYWSNTNTNPCQRLAASVSIYVGRPVFGQYF